jgi:hypothetical protein
MQHVMQSGRRSGCMARCCMIQHDAAGDSRVWPGLAAAEPELAQTTAMPRPASTLLGPAAADSSSAARRLESRAAGGGGRWSRSRTRARAGGGGVGPDVDDGDAWVVGEHGQGRQQALAVVAGEAWPSARGGGGGGGGSASSGLPIRRPLPMGCPSRVWSAERLNWPIVTRARAPRQTVRRLVEQQQPRALPWGVGTRHY